MKRKNCPKDQAINQSINQSINGYARALLKLSRREGEVLALVVEGKTSREIADELYLSVRTVENHRYRISKKLGLKGRGTLKRWVQRNCNGSS